MKMFKKRDPKNTKETPKPPEPEFFDSPDTDRPKTAFSEMLRKRSVRLVFTVIAVFLFSAVFLSSRKDKKPANTGPVLDDKRVIVTTASMERAIDVSAGGKKTSVRNQEEASSKRKKRKYDTSIAVFVEKPEKESGLGIPKSPEKETGLGVPSGTKIPALLSNRVFSFNVEAPVIAVVAKDFLFQDKLVIPKGSEFLGEAAVVKSVDRINVRFDLLIFPDGREQRVRALALSEDGSAGIKGKVDKHTDRKVLKAVGETLLAGASLFVGGQQADPFSLEDQMRLNLAQNLTNEASRDLRSTRIEKSVTVEAYTPIRVMVLEAV